MKGTVTSYGEFLRLYDNNSGVTVKMSEATGVRLRESLNLPPDASTEAVAVALDRLDREVRDHVRGLRSVPRGGPLPE